VHIDAYRPIFAKSKIVNEYSQYFFEIISRIKKNKIKMYPPELVAPMRADLDSVGFAQITTPEAVDAAVNSEGTVLVVLNSVCGCAAGSMRPGVKHAISTATKLPSKLTTTFAGVDTDAVVRARKYMLPYPPSSPAIALFKDGKLMHMIERHHIEGRTAEMIADNLKMAFEEYC
jgi:putative YphP/YqiW family bacilliredoxin